MQYTEEKTSIENLEPLVKLYQETGDNQYFDQIINHCRGYIQGRALKASLKFGLACEECESTLMVALWKSIAKYNPEMGLSFAIYANVGFRKHLTWLFTNENRDNHFFGPCTKSDMYEETSNKNKSFQMYYIDGGLSVDKEQFDMGESSEWDLYDPRMDVENLICEQDAARSLMEDIKKEDPVAGDVAALVATGRDKRETAVIMGYIPECSSQRTAQINWVTRRLAKCIPPVERHYRLMGIGIPLKMRA